MGSGLGGVRGGVYNGSSRGRRRPLESDFKLKVSELLLLFLLRWKCAFSDIWSAACAVFLLLHSWELNDRSTNSALIFMVITSVSCVVAFLQLFHCSLFIYLSILHLVPFSFFLSPLIVQQFLGLSHFLSSVPPFILPLLIFLFCFPTVPSFISWPLLIHYLPSLSLLLNSDFLLTHRETFVHRARISRVPCVAPSFCFSCHCCFFPSILSSTLSSPSISLSLTALLPSLHPPLFCPAAQ